MILVRARRRASAPVSLLAAATLVAGSLVTAMSGGVAAAVTVGATTPFTSYEAEAGALGGGASVVSLTAAPTT
ncbi:MAG: hypothetical protein QOF57_2817, partial [Frankiaceae bacterium]|nr:hypothetical protein [Frankiaceae bacterium]MDQ1726984.1 hypothetical protein [Frankiaceae bacterium]